MNEAEFEAKKKEILAEIPTEFHSSLSAYAWERGHPSGYSDILTVLSSLVWTLKDPIKKFESNVKWSVYRPQDRR